MSNRQDQVSQCCKFIVSTGKFNLGLYVCVVDCKNLSINPLYVSEGALISVLNHLYGSRPVMPILCSCHIVFVDITTLHLQLVTLVKFSVMKLVVSLVTAAVTQSKLIDICFVYFPSCREQTRADR